MHRAAEGERNEIDFERIKGGREEVEVSDGLEIGIGSDSP